MKKIHPADLPALPPSMYYRSGRYYVAKRNPESKKLVWTALSKKFNEAMHQYDLVMAGNTAQAFIEPGAPGHWLSNMAAQLHKQTAKRAKENDVMFTLTVDEVFQLGEASQWRCAVTGIRFRQDRQDGVRRRAFMPSIDRADCSLGYTKRNCRLVCVAVNIALSDWGEAVFREMSLSYVIHRKLATPLEHLTVGLERAHMRLVNK